MKSFNESLQTLNKKETNHDFQFQEVCTELQPFYGKAIWTLPYKNGVTEFKIREAHKIAKKRGITKFPYLVGIIKKL